MFDTAIIVSSCDKYFNTWEPFAHCFNKYWKDCPYPLYFITNHKDSPIGKTIRVGEDRGWASNMIHALKQVPEPIIIVLLEDYFLSDYVDSPRIEDLVSLVRNGAGQVRLLPCAESKEGRINEDALYIASLQPGIWNKEYFKTFLVPGDDAWAFELSSSRRYKGNGLNYSTLEPALPIWNFDGREILIRGVWDKDIYKFTEKEGIEIKPL